MKMKKIYITILVVLVSSFSLMAQKEIQLTQFGAARSIINPSLTAMNRYTEISVLAREQWSGFSKAPSTQFLSFELPLKKRFGIGAAVLHDQLGFENNYDITANWAWYIPVGESRNISAGLGFNVLSKNLSGSELIYDDMTDPNGVYTDVTRYSFNLNAGLGYSSEKFCIGISSRHLSGTGINASEIFKPVRHYYLFSSYRFKVNENFLLQPSMLLKSNGQKLETNLTLSGELVNTLTLGVNFRVEESVALILGINLIKNLRISYAYDIINGPVSKVSPASHELMLSYKFRKNPPKAPYIKSPRYFN